MEDKKIAYLKKHLTQALNEENCDEVNYCYLELSHIPDVDISEFTVLVNKFNEEHKFVNTTCSSSVDKQKELLIIKKKKIVAIRTVCIIGLMGGLGIYVLDAILIFLLRNFCDISIWGRILLNVGSFGVLIGTVFALMWPKALKAVITQRKVYFDELCKSQKKLQYLDAVETIAIPGKSGSFNYVGQIANGKMEGFGVSMQQMTTKFGRSVASYYIGDWIDGKKTGIGKLMSDDSKMILEGEYVSGLPNGIVDIQWDDGAEWHGEYKNGVPWDGEGKTKVKGHIQKGTWKSGIKVL